jgi:hypothetical protein
MVHVTILSPKFFLLFFLFAFNIKKSFALQFHLHFRCDILDFVNVFFPLTYRSSVMKNGRTCPLVIWQKLCITSSCRCRENMTFVCT